MMFAHLRQSGTVSGYFSAKVSRAAILFEAFATCSSSVSDRWAWTTIGGSADRAGRIRAVRRYADDVFQKGVFIGPLRVPRHQADFPCDQRKHVVNRDRLLHVSQQGLCEGAVRSGAIIGDGPGIGGIGDEDSAARLLFRNLSLRPAQVLSESCCVPSRDF